MLISINAGFISFAFKSEIVINFLSSVFVFIYNNILKTSWFENIAGGFLAAVLFYMVSLIIRKGQEKSKFGKFAGAYSCFGFDDDGNEQEQRQGRAVIKYLKSNRLSIEVTNPHPDDKKVGDKVWVWTGEMTIDRELGSTGKIVFHYENSDLACQTGLKKFVRRGSNIIYLIGEEKIGEKNREKQLEVKGIDYSRELYGDEILRREL